MTPIVGFSPGSDPTTPGIIIDCNNLVPTIRGLISSGNGLDVGLPAISGTLLEAETLQLLDNSARTFAGTSDKLYELSAGAWLDRSKVGGYGTAGDNTWCFCQFGNITIASNYDNPMQFSLENTFADLPGAPKAKVVETVAGFVMALNYNDGVNTFTDGWWCSGLYDYTQWTPSTASQAANGRLFDAPGPITGGKRLGSAMVAYKNSAMYLGQYIGPPVIWSWQQISSNVGAFNQEAIVAIDSQHYFIGDNGLFVYDGSRPMPIGTVEVKTWLKSVINQTYKHKCKASYDKINSLIYFFYPSQSSTGDLDSALVYNVINEKFGHITKDIKALLSYASPNMTWAQLGNLYATWGGWPNSILWVDTSFFGAEVGQAFIGSDQKISTFNLGGACDSYLITGDSGDDAFYSTLTRVRPRFLKSPGSGSLTHLYKTGEGNTLRTGVTVSMTDNKFDLIKSARFHRLKMAFSNPLEISGYDMELKPSGFQ